MRHLTAFLQELKDLFPTLRPTRAYHLALLEHQFQNLLLGAGASDFSEADFLETWTHLVPLSDGLSDFHNRRVELQVGRYLEDPSWAGSEALCVRIKDILESTMINDELEELRVLFLQNIFSGGQALDLPLLSLRLANRPEWSWVLDPHWRKRLDRSELIELMKLKYTFFQSQGWLTDSSASNPVIRFQLAYLQDPKMGLSQLLQMDKEIPQGSEIFLRLRKVNPFLISYFYAEVSA